MCVLLLLYVITAFLNGVIISAYLALHASKLILLYRNCRNSGSYAVEFFKYFVSIHSFLLLQKILIRVV